MTVLQGVAGGTHSWTIPTSLYTKIPSAKLLQGTLTIDTYNGATKIGTKSISITVMTNEEVCKPSLSATVVDSNSATITITGDKNKLVKNKSTAKVQITTNAKNSATISIKRVNGQTVTDNTIEIQNTETNVFTIEVTDSRGYSNTVTVTKTMIDYIPLSINANVVRKNPTSSEALLSFSGNYFNSKIGNTTNILQITLKYKLKSATEYSTTKTITPTMTSNTFSGSKASLGSLFNYQNAYDIQITAKDKLTTITTTVTLTRGIPVINWGKDFFNVNGKININGKSLLELVFPIGSTYITQTNTNPKNVLGFGTWERVKGKVLVGLDENDVDFNTIGKTGGSKDMQSHYHDIRFGDLREKGVVISYMGGSEDVLSIDSWSWQKNGKNFKDSGSNLYTGTEGTGSSGNLQPYQVIGYMWIRKS